MQYSFGIPERLYSFSPHHIFEFPSGIPDEYNRYIFGKRTILSVYNIWKCALKICSDKFDVRKTFQVP